MVTFFVCLVLLIVGFFTYSKLVEKIFRIDDRPTPAVAHPDGVDYVPMKTWRIFLVQLLNIAGLGPIYGALSGACWGPVVYLWIVFGTILGGGVHDFLSGMMSERNDGKSISEVVGLYMGKVITFIMRVFSVVLLVMVGVNFSVGPAGLLAKLTPDMLGTMFWLVVIMVYYLIATFLPIDKIIGKLYPVFGICLIIMALGIGGAIVLTRRSDMPELTAAAFTVVHPDSLPKWSMMFVTVACGAVSGFHSLVSSGTSSKTVSNEKDMLKVGYGAMILESLLAVIALCVAGAAAAADGTPADGTPFQIFSRGVASFFVGFGLDQHFASVFMTMCVSALALTSLDAVARIGRMSFQELFSVDDMEHAEGWRKLLCNVYFSTIITLVFGFILTKIGYANIWPLFGSANQLLSALVLATLCVFLKVTGRNNKMIFPPLIIMLCVTFTALVQRLIAMVKAISTAASVTIPAGETTWGAVFIANGLQLILAVLLIVLGLNIVVHSFKAYQKAEQNSEVKA